MRSRDLLLLNFSHKEVKKKLTPKQI
jgi:hypothetical protein